MNPLRTRLFAEALEVRCVPASLTQLSPPLVVVGGQSGGLIGVTRGDASEVLQPFGHAFASGVNVASADVTGDGISDIVAGAGAGAGPRVVVLDGRTREVVRSVFAFDPSFTGGVTVGVGDINFDGRADVVAAVESGAPHVKVYDGKTGAEVRSFFAYDPSFTGGVRVAAADVDGDLRDDIVTAPAGAGGPNVRVFGGADGSLVRSFFAYGTGYTGGVSVAAADVDRDGFADIVTGSLTGASHVKVFGGKSAAEDRSFFAFPPDDESGVRVAAALFNTDLAADIAVASRASRVRILDGQTLADLRDYPTGVEGFAGAGSVGVGPPQLLLSVPPAEPVPNAPAK